MIFPLFVVLTLMAFSCEENLPSPLDTEAAIETFFEDEATTRDWEEVDASELATLILDYISEHYGDLTIKKSWLSDEGEFMVALNKHLILVFDGEGIFVEEFEPREHRGDRDPIALTDIPQEILDFANANYPDEELIKAFVNDKGEYILKFEDCLVLVFDAEGNFIEEVERKERGEREREEVDEEDLPEAVLDYLEENYPDEEIEEIHFNDRRQVYVVELENDIILIFDAEGNFLERREDDEDGNRHGDRDHDDEHGNEIDPSELPQAILDYLSQNYPNEAIEEAYYNEEREVYKVELANDTYVFFDVEGNFIKAVEEDEHDGKRKKRGDKEEIDISELPQAALDYLSNNYPDDPIDEAYYHNEKETYVVELESGLKIVFDKDGAFLKVID